MCDRTIDTSWITEIINQARPTHPVPRVPKIFAYRLSPHSCRFMQVDRLEIVSGFPDIPSDPAVVVLNPHEEITPESFVAWLDRRQAGEPIDPGVRAADTLADARTAGEV